MNLRSEKIPFLKFFLKQDPICAAILA